MCGVMKVTINTVKSAPADCPSCEQKNYSKNSECDDCRKQL